MSYLYDKFLFRGNKYINQIDDDNYMLMINYILGLTGTLNVML